MKTQKISINWSLQPAHGESMTFLHDGKMFIKVGPVSDAVEVKFSPNGVYSVKEKIHFLCTEDAYSYYNQQWVDEEQKGNDEQK